MHRQKVRDDNKGTDVVQDPPKNTNVYRQSPQTRMSLANGSLDLVV